MGTKFRARTYDSIERQRFHTVIHFRGYTRGRLHGAARRTIVIPNEIADQLARAIQFTAEREREGKA